MDCSYAANATASKACIKNDAIKALNSTTWGELALNVCANYYPSLSTNVTLGPPPAGQLLVGPISKCQNMTFDAGEQWILSDVSARFDDRFDAAPALAPHRRRRRGRSAAAARLIPGALTLTLPPTHHPPPPQPWGNKYIMHASGANTTSGVDDAVASAVFPAGWSVKQASYNAFTLFPLMDDDGNCYYTGG